MERGAGAKAMTEPRAIGTLPQQWRWCADAENHLCERMNEQRAELYHSNGKAWAYRQCADELAASLAALAAQIAPIVQEMRRESVNGHALYVEPSRIAAWADRLAEIAQQLGEPAAANSTAHKV